MNPIYEKCYKQILVINNETLPTLGRAYRAYVMSINEKILESQCLNESRQITNSAIEVINQGYIIQDYSNKYVSIYLEELVELSKDMDKKANLLKDMLLDNQSQFAESAKILGKTNKELLLELKNGDTPAEELLLKISKLKKDIDDVIEKDIPTFANNINIYLITKIENEICDEVKRFKNEINRLDAGTLSFVMIDQWTDYIPAEILGDKVAFAEIKESL